MRRQNQISLKRPLKREARVALVEALKRGAVIVIIFRGGWIDGIMVNRGPTRLEELEKWLEVSPYFRELHGLAIGKDFLEVMGDDGACEFRAWAVSMGKEILEAGARNLRQAGVIIGALRENF